MEHEQMKPGMVIDERYEIVEILYGGKSSTVYLARQIENDNLRAIKEIWCGRLPEEEKPISKKLFDQEVAILRSLRHKNIPVFVDFFTQGEWSYLVMGYIKGRTLRQLKYERKQPVEIVEAIRWASELCDVLHFLHNRATPIVFRDLKPSHIMLSDIGSIKLIDFGLARLFSAAKKQDTFVQGTFGYAAPEQYGKKQTSPQSDIYALGATLYDLLTMQNLCEFLFDFPPIRKFNPKVPHWLEQTIAKCLEREPEKRYQDAMAIKKELDKWM